MTRSTVPSSAPDPAAVLPLVSAHPRTFHENRFAYPVVSRRSKGVSIGLNLNPDKVCNFDCIYCQVDRRSEAETKFVETDALLAELGGLLETVTTGALYDDPRFRDVPPAWRRLNDIAFSGDGEPTTYRNFDEIVAQVAAAKRSRGLDDVKLVLITNASMFHRPAVERALRILDENQGEVWAKLEAGTEAYFRRVDRTTIPFRRILDNLAAAARVRPLVIQSLFMRIEGESPPAAEIDAFCERLAEILAAGGRLASVQVYTVARPPAETFVAPLVLAELESIAARVRHRTVIPTECFGGSATETA
jgi:wyosine [tRNA(Phe)-imidazoG37] synthetase (radical SAM superfamily)